jgi:hypothetical protein
MRLTVTIRIVQSFKSFKSYNKFCGSGFLAAILYLLQQMTAKRSDPMTAQPHDAKLDET